MAANRVTQKLMAERAMYNLGNQMRGILDLQQQLATGLRVNAPSDGALETRRAVSARAAISKSEQYMTNMSTIGPQLLESSTSIQNVLDTLQRAYELAMQGANATYDTPQLEQIAIEVNELLEHVLNVANHFTDNRYIFGGTRTMKPPFVPARDADGLITAVAYEGNGEHIIITVAEGATLRVNETGADAFLANQDVFQFLIDLRDNLNVGDQAAIQENSIEEVAVAIEQLLVSLARIGSVQNRVERTRSDTDQQIVQLRQLLSDSIDADFGETIVKLNAQSNAYQAALNAAARVIQPSLLDFVR